MKTTKKKQDEFNNIVNDYIRCIDSISKMPYYKMIGTVEFCTKQGFGDVNILCFSMGYLYRAFYEYNGEIVELETVISPIAMGATRGNQYGLYSRHENKYLAHPYHTRFVHSYKDGDR